MASAEATREAEALAPAPRVIRTRWLGLSRSDAQLIGLTLTIKVALLGLGVLASWAIANEAVTSFGQALNLWNRWDGPHYLDLAVHGYSATAPGDLPLFIVFFPLYPWLTGGVLRLVGDPLVSALIVSGVASLFVAPLLARVVGAELGPRVGHRAAWFALIFPTAYFFHVDYTESLFLALVLGSFLAARADRWWLAGALGALAALTRINGLVLILALGAEAATQWWTDPAHRFRWRWLTIGLVAVGFGAYLLLNLGTYGNALTFLRIQNEHWFKSLAPPWDGIRGVIDSISWRSPTDALMLGWMELLFVAIGLLATVVAAFRFRPSWFAWMLGNWLLFTSTSFVLSVPRYTLTLFPLFALLAAVARDRTRVVVLSAVSLAAFGYFAAQFAGGQWAF